MVKDTTSNSVLIVGGGISGIQAALDFADQGYMVYLVEKNPSIGGHMAQLDKTFPTNDCAMCILAPKMVEFARYPNITLLSSSEVKEVKPLRGGVIFKVKILKSPRYVDETKCTGCRLCEDICPVEVPSEFDLGLKNRKAVYIPFPQAVPNVAVVDMEHCIMCGTCERVCKIKAMDFDQKPEELELEVASIIVSTGYDLLDPSSLRRFGYKQHPNILVALEYERLLSASGPTGGRILKLSNGDLPESIAFIQCVGSRDVNVKPYCSRICCMYATKEAIITKEHNPSIDVYILFNDIRAFGKGFQEYVNRAKNEREVTYIKGLPGEIVEDRNTEKLVIPYENTLTGQMGSLSVDMVVLCPAIIPGKDSEKLARVLGIDLDKYGFLKTIDTFSPIETFVPGIYTCGTCEGPKDIPTSVAEASATAAKSATRTGAIEFVERRMQVLERTISEEPRIGVFVCSCGVNIGSVVNVPNVVEYVKSLPNVIYGESGLFVCSSNFQSNMKEAIKEHDLNKVIVASCTPRTHEALFRATCQEVGLNPYLFEMVNIREQCSWVHSSEPERATEKAKDQIRMAVARTQFLKPLKTTEANVVPSVLVIGAGISGMTAAKTIADSGFKVYLIDRDSEMGGNLRHLSKLFYKDTDVKEELVQLTRTVKKNKMIESLLSSEVLDVNGSIGDFEITISQNGKQKQFHVGTIIVATGAKELKPNGFYGYGNFDNVHTQLDLEGLLDKNNLNNGETIVIIQCVGAREDKGRTYCPTICCPEALKNAIRIREQFPDTRVYLLYRDFRVHGEGEEYYKDAQLSYGIKFIRFDPAEPPDVSQDENGKSIVTVYDRLLGNKLKIPTDRIILSTPMVPREGNEKLSEILKVPLDAHGFFLEAHIKHRPVEFATDGIYLCGSASFPRTLDECVSQAYAAVSRALIPLVRGKVESTAIIAEVNEELCVGCGTCELTCEFGAVNVVEIESEENRAQVNPFLCKGCGACVASCPTGAMDQNHFMTAQILGQIKEAVSGPSTGLPRIIAFLCNWCSYAGADLAGVSRLQYPPSVRIIRLMCTGRFGIAFALQAILFGADGVLICGCHPGDCHYISGNLKAERRVKLAKQLLEKVGIDAERLRLEWVSASEGKRFQEIVANYTDEIYKLGLNPLSKM